MSVYKTSSDEETVALGRQIASSLPTRVCVLLIGNLGAGKTTLAKGIIQGLGAADPDGSREPQPTRSSTTMETEASTISSFIA